MLSLVLVTSCDVSGLMMISHAIGIFNIITSCNVNNCIVYKTTMYVCMRLVTCVAQSIVMLIYEYMLE